MWQAGKRAVVKVEWNCAEIEWTAIIKGKRAVVKMEWNCCERAINPLQKEIGNIIKA